MAMKKTISMQFHPRAFAAFGADLVTNDTVAVTELVKNCYDAFAYHVQVEFGEDKRGKYIQITDDGLGMTSDIIENSWAVIATPYKEKNPVVYRDGKIRRVSGNKGLGRFSAARLGSIMHIWTKSDSDSYLHAKMDWNSFVESNNVNDCKISIETLDDDDCVFDPSGTILRIRKLTSEWDQKKIDELRENLSRLISPFKKVDQFEITLTSPFYDAPIEIKPSDFIEHPTYRIWGDVDSAGVVNWRYIFEPKNKHQKCQKRHGEISWEEAIRGFNANVLTFEEDNLPPYKAGMFTFEIRCWDLDNDSLEDLTSTFGLKRRAIRNTISQYKGLSIYRDDVLVLPKSSASKDWLGFDLRRVSSIGSRIRTNQIIGIINISSSENPEIRDTTDREKLVDTQEYKQFSKIVETIISQLEKLRNTDKNTEDHREKPNISSLMAPLSAQVLVQKIEQAVDAGEKYENILEYVREYSSQNEKGLEALQSRLTYYAQTASLGSVAIVILHEILTGMTVIKRFLRRVSKEYSPFDSRTEEYYKDAEESHTRLLEVAKSFAPLYRADLRNKKNQCALQNTLLSSVRLVQGQKYAKDVDIKIDNVPEIDIGMHEGELQTVFVNLMDNACYWMKGNQGPKQITLEYKIVNKNRLEVTISDNGPGIKESDAQLIFDAGVTAKPHGIGMGLTIVTELLDYYNGKIATIVPGTLGGATFVFDVPIA